MDQITTPNFKFVLEHISERAKDQVSRWLVELVSVSNGEKLIYKSDFIAINWSINAAVETAWKVLVAPHVTNGLWQKLSYHERELYHEGWYVSGIVNLTRIPKMVKKHRLDSTKTATPYSKAMMAVYEGFLPVMEVLKIIKDKKLINNARKPKAAKAKTAAVNPNKDVKTCPVCLGKFAVVGKGKRNIGKMTHHGFRRPGHGYQTESCEGIEFPPLEVSNEGLIWHIAYLKTCISTTKDAIKGVKKATTLFHPWRQDKDRNFIKITPEHPHWKEGLDGTLSRLDTDVRYFESTLKVRERILAEWKPGIMI